MKIILTKEDIEELIKKAYSGVNDIKFNKEDIEVTLKMDTKFFETQRVPIVPVQIPQKEKEKIEKAMGLMSSSGERILRRV